MKFPSKECKQKAGNAVKECFKQDPQFQVSEPKKLKPKMTIVGIPASLSDSEIVTSITDKSSEIKDLVNKGSTMELCFTRVKGEYKHAVIKMSPEIRSFISKRNGQIYVGLSSCKAYDRFWVTQCYHCQGFGHVSSKCSRKNESPTCSFCAGRHESRTCENKSSPKCCNCSAPGEHSGSTDHFSSSMECPAMMVQRQQIIENTELSV